MKLFENKNLIRVIALALIAVLGFSAPAGDYVNSGGTTSRAATTAGDGVDTVADATTATGTAAAADGKQLPEDLNYVSEVRLFQSGEYEFALKDCKEAGYEPVEADLNKGTEKSGWGDIMSDYGSGDAVVLGYKTTKDRSQAITSMKMAEMETGYQMFDYDEIEKSLNTGMNYMAEDIVSVLAEINKNIAAGDMYAGKVKDALNMYYIPYMKDKGLGDFLFDPATDAGKIAQVLKRSNMSVITSMLTNLTMGVAGARVVGQNGNLAERIANNSRELTRMKNSEYITLDSLYKDSISDIRTSLQNFANEIEPALKAYQDAGGTMSQSFMDEHPGEAINIKIYENLNQYTMADGTGVGKYLYHIGSTSLKSKEDMREAYPIVMAMSPGQLLMFSYTGVFDAVTYMDESSEKISDAEAAMEEVSEKVKKSGLEETKDGRIPIYPPGQDTLYRSKVAMTSEALRAASARDEYHKLTQYDKDMALWNEVFMWSNRIITFAMAAYFLGAGVTWVIAHTSAKWLLQTAAMQVLTKLGWPIRILGNNWITFIVVIVIILVWFAVLKLKASYSYYNPDYKEVPRYMYSVEKIKNSEGKKENEYILYTPAYNGRRELFKKYVTCDDYRDIEYGDSAKTIEEKEMHNKALFSDFNARQGKKWNALYTTKDPKAGSPICAEDVKDIFLVKYGEYNQGISGYKAFSSFGNENPVNLNSNQYADDVGGIYLYYRTEETILDPETASFPTDGKYVSDLVIVSEKKEKDAKAAVSLKAGKYRIIDQNLTPDQGYYTYIGYSVTDNINDAIRDIRVDSISTGNSMSGGYRRNNIGYAEVGSTVDGKVTLYQTAVKSGETDMSDKKTLTYTDDEEEEISEEEAVPGDRQNTVMSYSGAPILPDFKIVDSLDKAPVGYEPIIPGSGGVAYNFNTRYNKDKDTNKRYVYFQPAVSIVPEGTDVKAKKGVTYVYSDEEYLSGIQAFILPAYEAKKEKDRIKGETEFKDRIKSMGYTPFDVDIAGDHKGSSPLKQYCVIGYSTTVNPFRAISDIKYYKGAGFSGSIQPSAPSSEGTYIAMDVFSFDDLGLKGEGWKQSKCYIGSNGSESMTYTLWPESAESWDPGTIKEYKYTQCPARGLYILAADEDHPALRPSDILVTNDKTVPSGMRPISHMIYPYMTENFDISSYHIGAYFYIRKEKEQRGKYVSGIHVGTYTLPDDNVYYYKAADDAAMLAAYAGCNGEVLWQNIGVEQRKAWYSGTKKYSGKYSYMGVSYTDDKEDALTGLIRYKYPGSSAPNQISVGGVKYEKAGDAVGGYCYYTTKSENASPGMPITEVSLDDKLLAGGGGTVFETKNVDGADLQKKLDAIDDDDDLELYEKVVKKAEIRKASAKYGAKTMNGIGVHLKVDDSNAIMTDVYIGHGNSIGEAAADALSQGATFFYSYNTNLGIRGHVSADGIEKGLEFGSDSMEPVKQGKIRDYICIGYNIMDADQEDAEYLGIRDILMTIGEPYREEGFEKDGCEYLPVSDTSLNAGSDGEDIYMYSTWDESDKTSSPITSLALAKGDSIPAGAGNVRYEYIMTNKGEKANLNYGATAVETKDRLNDFYKAYAEGLYESIYGEVYEDRDEFDFDVKFDNTGKLMDTRLWLFAHRYDNTAKRGALFDITDAGRKTTRMDVTINA